ncbi:hypothetical protein MPER_11409 [Moniliophthora perniciosa FA553]|nr:hypothetical protein MPER_11409 [Moniliophthora perniciosa FA553]
MALIKELDTADRQKVIEMMEDDEMFKIEQPILTAVCLMTDEPERELNPKPKTITEPEQTSNPETTESGPEPEIPDPSKNPDELFI